MDTTTKNQEFIELRRRASALGIEGVNRQSAENLRAMIRAAETRDPVDPSDFGDIGPVMAAPDDASAPHPDLSPPPKPAQVPIPPPLPNIVIDPASMAMAIRTGQAGGLPETPAGQQEEQQGSEVLLGRKVETITAGIAGHAVRCVIETRTVMTSWVVEGSAADLTGKWRLMAAITITTGGNVQTFKAGDEFYAHQVPFEVLKQAGAMMLQIGTTR